MNNGFTTASRALLAQLANSIQNHPKRLTAVIAALFLSGGGGAFAVASLVPDPSDLPVRLVEQPVDSLATGVTLADLIERPGFSLYRSEQVRSSDTPESLLRRLGVADPAAAAFLRRDAHSQKNLLGRDGRTVSVETTDDHRLLRITARWAPDDETNFKRLVVEKTQGGFVSRIESAPLTTSSRLAGGVVRSTLFAATDAASIPDTVAVQLAEMFSGDIDFRKALRQGDLEEFVKLYNISNRNQRQATWSPENPDGRWRDYRYDELIARDKASLDIFWLKDDSLADSDNLPAPGVIALEIVEDLQAALEQFKLIAGDLGDAVEE